VETDARRRGIGLLRNGVLDNDHRAHALLHARGYRIVRHFYRMAIELDAPPPPPEWPEGLRSSVYDSREARAFHAALEEAFEDEWDHEPESFDDWRRRRLEAPNVDPTLWFAVSTATRSRRRQSAIASASEWAGSTPSACASGGVAAASVFRFSATVSWSSTVAGSA
jgi:hypothetical protein